MTNDVNMQTSPETSLLGAMLLRPECADTVFGNVAESDFEYVDFSNLYTAIKACQAKYGQIDLTLLPPDCREIALRCAEICPAPSGWQHYMQAVRDGSTLRKAIPMALGIAKANDINALREQVASLNDILEKGSGKEPNSSAKSLIVEWMQEIQRKPNYIATHLGRLDQYVYMSPGDFVIVGARPSVGKTALGVQLAVNMLKDGRRVGFFSLETCNLKMMNRFVCCLGGIEMKAVKEHDLNGIDTLPNVVDAIYQLPLDIFQASGKSVAWMRAVAAKHKLDVCIVDYLQLVPAQGKNLYEKTTCISQQLHEWAQQSGCLIIALAQLNRNAAGSELPSLQELRDSGSIEQDADCVLLLHHPENKPFTIKIAKNKEGRCGRLDVDFNESTQQFLDIDENIF